MNGFPDIATVPELYGSNRYLRTHDASARADVDAEPFVHLSACEATPDEGGATVVADCGSTIDGLPDLSEATLTAFGFTRDPDRATCPTCRHSTHVDRCIGCLKCLSNTELA